MLQIFAAYTSPQTTSPSDLEAAPLLMVVSLVAAALIFGLHHLFIRFRLKTIEENEATAMRFRHPRKDDPDKGSGR